MSESREPVRPLVEFAISFHRPGGGAQVYLVKGILGPAPHAACCNVLRVKGEDFAVPEVVTADAGTLSDLFRRVETILTDRHPGCRKEITFDYTKGW
jgi:hypothetical protein